MPKAPNKKQPFNKPACTPEQHVELMAKRGLSIPDAARAQHYLRFISYYRLSGYALSFQKDNNNDGSHTFEDGTDFEQLLNLYIFDRKLRLLIIDALERIEVAFRACISDELSIKHGPHWYMDPKQFDNSFDHKGFLGDVRKTIQYDAKKQSSSIIFVDHYYKKYDTPDLPPSWMVFELISFGSISFLFSKLTVDNKKLVSKPFGLHHKVVRSWLHSLSYLRNLCAHHQRLWNRVFTIKPLVSKGYECYLDPNDRLYAQLVVVQILLKKIAHDASWHKKLNQLLNGYNYVSAKRMGFPDDWRRQPLWGLGRPTKNLKVLPAG